MSRECRHISGAVHFSGGLRLGRGLRCWSGCRGYFHKRTRSTRRLRSHVEVRLSFVKEIFTPVASGGNRHVGHCTPSSWWR